MRYVIKKYKLEKVYGNSFMITALVFKKNIFGGITDTYYETLDENYKCKHEVRSLRVRALMCPIVGRKKAKQIIDTLEKVRNI